jgi:hypothetical protein
MIAIPTKYQIHFFANMAGLTPSADIITALLNAFRGEGLLPSTFQEFKLPLQEPELRLRFSSPSGEWVIDFDSGRITLDKNSGKPLGANLGEPEEFVRDAVNMLGRILQLFPRKATRLSLVTDGLMAEMPDHTLTDLYSQVVVPSAFYRENPPIAWNTRSLSRVSTVLAGNQEQVNVITQVNRVQGKLLKQGGLPFDRIQILFDVNTYQANSEPRFGIPEVSEFYASALKTRDTILKDLKERLHG